MMRYVLIFILFLFKPSFAQVNPYKHNTIEQLETLYTQKEIVVNDLEDEIDRAGRQLEDDREDCDEIHEIEKNLEDADRRREICRRQAWSRYLPFNKKYPKLRELKSDLGDVRAALNMARHEKKEKEEQDRQERLEREKEEREARRNREAQALVLQKQEEEKTRIDRCIKNPKEREEIKKKMKKKKANMDSLMKDLDLLIEEAIKLNCPN
jgi:hypothetical protein